MQTKEKKKNGRLGWKCSVTQLAWQFVDKIWEHGETASPRRLISYSWQKDPVQHNML